ncbi:type II secretion system protein [candidate division KSB1 bacterium]
MKKFSDPKAFTLIELVMVIVILGILAATAIPKFTDLSQSAYKAAMNGTAGAVRGGITTVRSANLINGVNSTNGGWPAALGTNTGLATLQNPLFISVLDQGGITEAWNKTGGAIDPIITTGQGSASTYTYTKIDTGDVTFIYDANGISTNTTAGSFR